MGQILVASFDLDTLPYDPGAYASSGTYVTGRAAVIAAEQMREQMRGAAARLLDLPVDEIEYDSGVLVGPGGKKMTLSKLATTLCSFAGMDQLISKGTYGGETSPPPFIAGFAEVEVDLETGESRVLDYVAVTDCGTVLNEEWGLGCLRRFVTARKVV
jgi:CO/xanthine dehydrogenase Mo-binding subunit